MFATFIWRNMFKIAIIRYKINDSIIIKNIKLINKWRSIMSLMWTPNLAVGVDLIDQQHKTWFEKADKLFEAGKTGKTKEYIVQMFDFLDDYTKTHFKDEENYMLSINYPDYKIQKQLHENFIKKLADLRKEYEKSGANISVIIDSNQFILDWLTNHISKMDKKIGEYVRKQNK